MRRLLQRYKLMRCTLNPPLMAAKQQLWSARWLQICISKNVQAFLWKSELFPWFCSTSRLQYDSVPLCHPWVSEPGLFVKLPSVLRSTPSLPDPQTRTWMQMCLLAMKKLSVLICRLGPGDKSDHGDGVCLARSPLPFHPPSPTRGCWPSRGSGSAGGGLVQSAGCRCCSQSGSVSPKRPQRQKTKHITVGVTLKPTERNINPWTHHAASHMTPLLEIWVNTALLFLRPAADAEKCIVCVAVIRIRTPLMSRRRNLFIGAQLIWIASRPATVCRH